MEMDALWNTLLTAIVGLIVWWIKSQSDEAKRVQILLNRTREEIARDYVTKQEVHADINRVLDRLERLDEKLDRMLETRK